MPNWRAQTCSLRDPPSSGGSCQKQPVSHLNRASPQKLSHENQKARRSELTDSGRERRSDLTELRRKDRRQASGWVLEFRVVENVEEFGAEGQLDSLGPGIPDLGEAFATTRNRHRHQEPTILRSLPDRSSADYITSTGWKGLPLRRRSWVKNWWVLFLYEVHLHHRLIVDPEI
jgi:hypothetical protein